MKTPDPDYLKIADIIHAALKDRATEEDWHLLTQWLEESDENRALFEDLRNDSYLAQKFAVYEKIDLTGNRERFIRRLAMRRRRFRIARYCAAVLLPLVTIAGFWHFSSNGDEDFMIAKASANVTLTLPDGKEIILDNSAANCLVAENGNIGIVGQNGAIIHEIKETAHSKPEISYATLDVMRGTLFDMVLADGTRVWLNAGSSLSFPTIFTDNERRVILAGEAYFDVARDDNKPFIVETAAQSLLVTGTEFNICAYPSESAIYTSLISGSVSLTSKASGITATLSPGQQAKLTLADDAFVIQPADIESELAWRDMMLSFDGKPLEYVFLKLSRWYDFTYTFDDADAAGLQLTGAISTHDDINRIFKQISALGQVSIKNDRNNVSIKLKR